MVLINVMRGGPGLGSIGPSQADYFQATRGHGHGDYRAPVLAPASIPEAVELVADAFEIAARYRTAVIILADGIMGQAMEPVVPTYRAPAWDAGAWQLEGADGRPPRVVKSLHLLPEDLERHNAVLQAKFDEIGKRETRWAGESLDDAEICVVAYGTSARIARTAVERVRSLGMRAGLFRPISLWPFPTQAIADIAPRVRAFPRRGAVGWADLSRMSGSRRQRRRCSSTAGRAVWSRHRARSLNACAWPTHSRRRSDERAHGRPTRHHPTGRHPTEPRRGGTPGR